MPIRLSKIELTNLFAKLGASSPERWANSQIDEGIPQLLRFLFLKSAWETVTPDGDDAWIDEEIKMGRNYPKAPYAGLGQVLEKLRSQGVANDDLTIVARCLQAQTIFNLSNLIDSGPSIQVKETRDVAWGLFQVDDDGRPFGPRIAGLHESVLSLDPTGREMRPVSLSPDPQPSPARTGGRIHRMVLWVLRRGSKNPSA